MIGYKDGTNTPHRIRRSLALPFSRLKTADLVEVIYPAGQPDKGVVNTWDELFLVPLFWAFMTLAFLVLFRHMLNGTIQS